MAKRIEYRKGMTTGYLKGYLKGYKAGYDEFTGHEDCRNLVDEFQKGYLERLWDSVLYLSKAIPLARQYVFAAIERCRTAVKERHPDTDLAFDYQGIFNSLPNPPPDWHGDVREKSEATWWKEVFDQALEHYTLKGPSEIPPLYPPEDGSTNSFPDTALRRRPYDQADPWSSSEITPDTELHGIITSPAELNPAYLTKGGSSSSS